MFKYLYMNKYLEEDIRNVLIRHIVDAINQSSGNLRKAALILEMERSNLYRYMNKLGINVERKAVKIKEIKITVKP